MTCACAFNKAKRSAARWLIFRKKTNNNKIKKIIRTNITLMERNARRGRARRVGNML